MYIEFNPKYKYPRLFARISTYSVTIYASFCNFCH